MSTEIEDQIYTKKELAAFLRLSQRSVDRAIEQGVLPKGFKIGGGSVRWRKSVIEGVIAKLDQADG